MDCDFDAIIIGGGPAGATAALLLARLGWSVALIEKNTFPRPKVCGEFISATNFPLLMNLGLMDFYQQQAGPSIKRVGWFGGEKSLTATMPAVNHSCGQWGRALGREYLDTVLLNEAKKAGVTIWQPCTAQQIMDKKNYFVCLIETKKDLQELTARTVVIAQGSWEKAIIKKQQTPHKNLDLLAFKTHFRETTLEEDLMALISFPGGYGGLVHSDNDRVSLSCCIRRDMLQKIRANHPGQSASEVLLEHLFLTCRGAEQVLASAKQEENWLSIGPLRPGIRYCYGNGLFYVGNIAGEAHPIIAEGISMAMQSAWLLAITLSKDPANSRTDLINRGVDYSKKWHQQFTLRIRAAAFFAHLTYHPRSMRLLLPLVARFPELLTFGATLSGKKRQLQLLS
ncbi:FAD-dependent oxidoreductase [Legionella jamestowniensis]|uniref:Protein CbrA n=1 Tax=Legionella jamestowniensis TaxID=455 RepID=A0ABX2Y011_9GAMM|nr:FAD-dependent oxidoreductase [Legionella jamestowniensis]OCH99449.1 FAD-dependent oxidoreductase [Legionella jamestowniensis]